MSKSIYSTIFIIFICIELISCKQKKENNKNYLIDQSILSQINKKIKPFNKQANSNISFTILENDKIITSSIEEGEPALSFTTFIENGLAIECLNGIKDGFGFSLILNEDTTIIKFKVLSNSNKIQFRASDRESLQPELLVNCINSKITLVNPPKIKQGEIIQGKVELESDYFFEVSNNEIRKLKFKLVVYFKSEPTPVIDKQYKTLSKPHQ